MEKDCLQTVIRLENASAWCPNYEKPYTTLIANNGTLLVTPSIHSLKSLIIMKAYADFYGQWPAARVLDTTWREHSRSSSLHVTIASETDTEDCGKQSALGPSSTKAENR